MWILEKTEIMNIRYQFHREHPKVELGEIQPVRKCCREIQIQLFDGKEGQVYHGYNTIKKVHEYWLCVSVEKDYRNTQMQRLYGYVDET